MTTEQNKARARAFIKALNERDMPALAAMVAPEIMPDIAQMVDWMYAALGDHHVDIVDMIAEDNRVWTQVATSGAHTGEVEGLSPTGNRFTNRGVSFMRFSADGIVTERYEIFDNLNLVKQFGGRLVSDVKSA